VLNRGDEAIQVDPRALSAPLAYTGGVYPGTNGTCRTFISADEVCDLQVEVTPASPFGQLDAAVVLDYEGVCGNSSLSVPVEGTLLEPARLTVEPSPLSFGAVDGNATESVTVTNEGDVAATLSESGDGAGPFDYVGGAFPGGGSCTSTLAPGESCDIGVSFSPTGTATVEESMSLQYEDGCEATSASIAVEGRGSTAVSITPSGETLDLGTRNCPASAGTYTWTVLNDGQLPISDVTVTLDAAGAFFLTDNTCESSLAGGESCKVDVTHNRPCMVPSFLDQATLTIEYDDGQPQSFSVAIQVYRAGCSSC
jgi:hypothetical protein